MEWSRSMRWLTILLFVSLAGLFATGQAQEMVAARHKAPELVTSVPDTATAGTDLQLEGYRLGWSDESDVQVLFIQGEVQYRVRPTGGGWQAGDLDGLQYMKVTVPQGLAPGECQIVVDVNGTLSKPLKFEIGWMAQAPNIIDVSPHWAQPSEVIWISGNGFGQDDEIELTDSTGKQHLIVAGSTSSGTKSAFSLPADLPDGTTSVSIIEHRSGANQHSNSISFSVSNGPVPLEIWSNWLSRVSPGQWMELVVTTIKPLEKANRAELMIEQKGHKVIVPIIGKVYPRAYLPKSLKPGLVSLSTRTWLNGRASTWSDAIAYHLLDTPAPPTVMSVEPMSHPEPVYLGPSAPESLNVKAGDVLLLRGKFPVADAEHLRITLESNEGRFTLTPTGIEPGAVKVALPKDLKLGDWQISMSSVENNAISKLPICFHVE